MGTRSSRLHEEAAATAFDKDGIKRESCRRIRSTRPTSLMVEFSGSFDHDLETNRSRSEEGSDSDTGQQASGDGSPADSYMSPSLGSQASPTDENGAEEKREEDGSPGGPVSAEEIGRAPQRTFSERLPGGRHSSAGGITARSARVRGTHARPVSEAWIGLYRVNNRHGGKWKDSSFLSLSSNFRHPVMLQFCHLNLHRSQWVIAKKCLLRFNQIKLWSFS